MFYLTLFAFLLQMMMTCGVSVAVSMVTKSEIMSMMASVLLLLGLDNIAGTENYLSSQGRFRFLFQYFGELTHGVPPFGDEIIVTADDVVMLIAVPVSIFAVLIVLSFVYFTRVMEVD
jgi:hypothetical protein